MKNLSRLRAVVAAVFLLASQRPALGDSLTVPAPTVRERQLTWVRNGEATPLFASADSRNVFLTVEQLARLSQSQLRWQSVSGQACLSRSDSSMCFNWNDSSITKDGERISKKYDLKFENNQLLIPVRLTTSKEFRSFTRNDFTWDPRKSELVQTAPLTVQVPSVERMDDRYRLSLPASPDVPHYLVQKDKEKIWIRFVKGNSEGSQILEGDAIVRQVRMVQRRHSADLIVTMGPKADSSEVYFDEGAQKLIIDVYSSHAVADVPAPAARPEISKEASATVKKSSPAPAHRIAVLPAKPAVPAASGLPAPASLPEMSERERRAPMAPSKNETRTIVIDAGHGGMDSGAIGSRGTMEKDVNLQVARALAAELRKQKGFKVILTRNSDEFIPLSRRTEIANEARADLFVSIHCNASLSAKSTGSEIYFLSPGATDKAAEAVARIENSVVSLESEKSGGPIGRLSEMLASMAVYNYINESSQCAAFISKLLTNKAGVEKTAVKEADFYVLRGAQMPAVLVELEYLSNPLTELKLRSSRFRTKMVRGITDGILAYHRHVEKTQAASAGRLKKAEAARPKNKAQQ